MVFIIYLAASLNGQGALVGNGVARSVIRQREGTQIQGNRGSFRNHNIFLRVIQQSDGFPVAFVNGFLHGGVFLSVNRSDIACPVQGHGGHRRGAQHCQRQYAGQQFFQMPIQFKIPPFLIQRTTVFST